MSQDGPRLDPLEKFMSAFDITGQQGMVRKGPPPPPPLAGEELPESNDPKLRQQRTNPSQPSGVRRALSMGVPKRAAVQTHTQQLKKALAVQSAHVMTHDYLVLSQSLNDGLLLMDRMEHKLRLIHSLGELMPLHSYTTEHGNSLTRPAKHKAVLAGSIDIEIAKDEIDFDTTLGQLSLTGGTASTLNREQRMAAYTAFSAQGGDTSHANGSSAAQSTAVPPLGNGEAVREMLFGTRLEETAALERLEQLQARISEMELWFVSVKDDAASEKHMREQAHGRIQMLEERVEHSRCQLERSAAENAALHERIADLQNAEPERKFGDGYRRAEPKPMH